MGKPQKIFLSYKFTGEDINELTDSLKKILSALRAAGHNVYCAIEDKKCFKGNNRTSKEIILHIFKQLDNCDMILAFVNSDKKSEGMLLEIGYAAAKNKKLAIVIKQGIETTFLTNLAEMVIEFSSIDDLCGKLSEVIL
jgi:nucleoside 2-deoxyribosyltransferase